MPDVPPVGRQALDTVEFVLCDLDGVVWLAHDPVPGAREAIERLRRSGRRVLFVTNNSVDVEADHERALAAIGIPAEGDVVSSAQAAASLLVPGERVAVCGGRGVVEAVEAVVGSTVSFGDDVDAVVVGLDRTFDFARLDAVSRTVRDGARFIATNLDATFPTPGGLTPGAGAVVAAISTAAGRSPIVAGKPNPAMAELVRRRCGPRFGPRTALVVGDRWSTDGAFAGEIGCPFALVRSGVTAPGAPVGGTADVDLPDLAAVADLLT